MRAVVVTVSAVLWGGHALAAGGHSFTVGTCRPGSNTASTIQGAVDAIGTPGTISICPGTYPEQVVIDAKNLTLKGLTDSNSSAATIVLPSGGLVANATSQRDGTTTYGAQILVRNGAVANINNVVIDATGATGGDHGPVGVLFQSTSGSVNNSSIVNQTLPPNESGDQTGLGILAQGYTGPSSNVTVSGTFVSNYEKNGITGQGSHLTMTVTGNTVVGKGPTMGAAENAIEIAFGATGTVSGNWVADSIWVPQDGEGQVTEATGILVYDSASVQVTKNVVTDTQLGIAVIGDSAGLADGAQVTGNRVSATKLFDGIDICGSNNTTVGTNTVVGSDESAIHIDSECGAPSTGETVTSNKINAACAGILVGSGSTTPTPGSNTIINTTTQILTGSDTCPAAPAGPANFSRVRVAHHHVSPAR